VQAKAAKLDLIVETPTPRGLRSRLRHVILAMMKARELKAQVCIVISTDEHLQALKLEHWGEDAATDVLSFPAWEPGDPFVPAHLGDIIISLDTAKKQALEQKHSLETEVIVLASHGLTHLLGFDHQTPEGWAAFKAAELEAHGLLKQNRVAKSVVKA
jgi:probable rRNA maturation factor